MIANSNAGTKANKRAAYTFRKRILSWYGQYGRKFPWRNKSATVYEQVIAEVLLQRTRAETVAKFYPAFIRDFPSWQRLAKASEKQLRNYLQPIGLWRRRAAAMKKLAEEMSKRRGRYPKSREEIENLPGVGQYIANSIMVFCYDDAWPLLDTNMARVLERYFGPRRLADIRYDPDLQATAKAVVSGTHPEKINWGILDLAALICTIKNPRHEACPLKKGCKMNEWIMGSKHFRRS